MYYTLDELNTLIAESERAHVQALANAAYHEGQAAAWKQTKAKMQETPATPKSAEKPAKDAQPS